MIYRVHYPHDDNGNIGKAIGYITICPAVSSVNPIYNSLRKEGFLTISWEDTLISAHASNVPGAIEYEVKRRRPTRERLLYLVPLQPVQAAKLSNGVVSFGTFSSSPTTSTTSIGRIFEVLEQQQQGGNINVHVNAPANQWRVVRQAQNVAPQVAQNEEAPLPPFTPRVTVGFTTVRRNNQ